MRVITFHKTASGTLSWVVDRDSMIVSCNSSTANVILSEDPAMTFALVTAPTANFSGERLEVSGSNLGGLNLQIPVEVGTTLYLNFSAAGTAWLFLEDAISVDI